MPKYLQSMMIKERDILKQQQYNMEKENVVDLLATSIMRLWGAEERGILLLDEVHIEASHDDASVSTVTPTTTSSIRTGGPSVASVEERAQLPHWPQNSL
jgi:hypothetical protein